LTLIRFDECISWRIVDALRALSLPRGVTLETPQHRSEHGDADINWIEDFARRDGRLFVSGDASMRTTHLERAALEASGLVAVFPSSKQWFDGLKKWGQAAYLTVWFPSILRLATEAERGTHWRLPASFSGEFTSLIPMKSLAEIEVERETKARQREIARETRTQQGRADGGGSDPPDFFEPQ
jgi:hypothetical protein